MKIAVIGLGYVGLANAVHLAARNTVTGADISAEKCALLARGVSPIRDPDIEQALAHEKLTLTVTDRADEACAGADFIFVAVPTDPRPDGSIDTQLVDAEVRRAFVEAPGAVLVLRSTLPVGTTDRIAAAYPGIRILFVPEFSREGHSLHDVRFPDRLIVGVPRERPDLAEQADRLVRLLLGEPDERPDVPVLITGAAEAEAVKLFSNTYLAMRVGFFNELDSFAEDRNLDARAIVDGVSGDPRIGGFYNNPSFGFGGNCLPKDSSQLIRSFRDTETALIRSVPDANELRKDHVVKQILRHADGGVIGIYRLAMKKGSDNFRKSALRDVTQKLRDSGASVLLYEPAAGGGSFDGVPLENDLAAFKTRAAVIVANRWDDALEDVREKVYTRDLYRLN